MSAESRKVVEFCRDNDICVRCKCHSIYQKLSICLKCYNYILRGTRDSSFAKMLLKQHGV